MGLIKVLLAGVALAVVGLAAWVRLAPIDAAGYAVLPAVTGPGDTPGLRSFTAVRDLAAPPDRVLAALDAAALATPRTTRIAGSVAQERLTYMTRSAVWGFPDLTTAGIVDGRLVLHGRARFGKSDLGVNRARLLGWIAALGPLVVPAPGA